MWILYHIRLARQAPQWSSSRRERRLFIGRLMITGFNFFCFTPLENATDGVGGNFTSTYQAYAQKQRTAAICSGCSFNAFNLQLPHNRLLPIPPCLASVFGTSHSGLRYKCRFLPAKP